MSETGTLLRYAMLENLIGGLVSLDFDVKNFKEVLEEYYENSSKQYKLSQQSFDSFCVLLFGDEDHYSLLECLDKLLNACQVKDNVIDWALKLLYDVINVSPAFDCSSWDEALSVCCRLAVSLPALKIQNLLNIVRSMKPSLAFVVDLLKSVVQELRFPYRKEYKGLGVLLYYSYLFSISSDNCLEEEGKTLILKSICLVSLSSSPSVSDICLTIQIVSYLLPLEEGRPARRNLLDYILKTLFESSSLNNEKVVECTLTCLISNISALHESQLLSSVDSLKQTLQCMDALLSLGAKKKPREDIRTTNICSLARSFLVEIVRYQSESPCSTSLSNKQFFQVLAKHLIGVLNNRCGLEILCTAIVCLSHFPDEFLKDRNLLDLNPSDVFDLMESISTVPVYKNLASCSLVPCLKVYFCLLENNETLTVPENQLDAIVRFTIPFCVRNSMGDPEALGRDLTGLYRRLSARNRKSFAHFVTEITTGNVHYSICFWKALYSCLCDASRMSLCQDTLRASLHVLGCATVPGQMSTSNENPLVSFVSEIGDCLSEDMLSLVNSRFSSMLILLLNRRRLTVTEDCLLSSLSKWAVNCSSLICNSNNVLRALILFVTVERGPHSESCVSLLYKFLEEYKRAERVDLLLKVFKSAGLVEALFEESSLAHIRLLVSLLELPDCSAVLSKLLPMLLLFLYKGEAGYLPCTTQEEWFVIRHSILHLIGTNALDFDYNNVTYNVAPVMCRKLSFSIDNSVIFLPLSVLRDVDGISHVIQMLLLSLRRGYLTAVDDFLNAVDIMWHVLPRGTTSLLEMFFKNCFCSIHLEDDMVLQVIKSLLEICGRNTLLLPLLAKVMRLVLPLSGQVYEPPFYNERTKKCAPVVLQFLSCLGEENVSSFVVVVYNIRDSLFNLPQDTCFLSNVLDTITHLSNQEQYRSLLFWCFGDSSILRSRKVDVNNEEGDSSFAGNIPDPLSSCLRFESCTWASFSESDWESVFLQVSFVLRQSTESLGWCRDMLLSLPSGLTFDRNILRNFFSAICSVWRRIWESESDGEHAHHVMERLLHLGLCSGNMCETSLSIICDVENGWIMSEFGRRTENNTVKVRVLSILVRIFKDDSTHPHYARCMDAMINFLVNNADQADSYVCSNLLSASFNNGQQYVLKVLALMFHSRINECPSSNWFESWEHAYDLFEIVWTECISTKTSPLYRTFLFESILLPCATMLSNHNQEKLFLVTSCVISFAQDECQSGHFRLEFELIWMRMLNVLLPKLCRRLINCLVISTPEQSNCEGICALCQCNYNHLPHGKWSSVRKLLAKRCAMNIVDRKVTCEERSVLSIHSLFLILSISKFWSTQSSILGMIMPSFKQVYNSVPDVVWPIGINHQKLQCEEKETTSSDTDMIHQTALNEEKVGGGGSTHDAFAVKLQESINKELGKYENLDKESVQWTSFIKVLSNKSSCHRSVNSKLLVLSVIIGLEWHSSMLNLLSPLWSCALNIYHLRTRDNPSNSSSVPFICIRLIDRIIYWAKAQNGSSEVFDTVCSDILLFLNDRLEDDKTYNKRAITKVLARANNAWRKPVVETNSTVVSKKPLYSESLDPFFQSGLRILEDWDRANVFHAVTGDEFNSSYHSCAHLKQPLVEDNEQFVSSDITKRVHNLDCVSFLRKRLRQDDKLLALSLYLVKEKSALNKSAVVNKVLSDIKQDDNLYGCVVSLAVFYDISVNPEHFRFIITIGDVGLKYFQTQHKHLVQLSTKNDEHKFMLDNVDRILTEFGSLQDSCMDRSGIPEPDPVDRLAGLSEFSILYASHVWSCLCMRVEDQTGIWKEFSSNSVDISDLRVTIPLVFTFLLRSHQWELAYYVTEQLASMICGLYCTDARSLITFGMNYKDALKFYLRSHKLLASMNSQLMLNPDTVLSASPRSQE